MFRHHGVSGKKRTNNRMVWVLGRIEWLRANHDNRLQGPPTDTVVDSLTMGSPHDSNEIIIVDIEEALDLFLKLHKPHKSVLIQDL